MHQKFAIEANDHVLKELKEKHCKLQTSDEILELLKKYNYREGKGIFEKTTALDLGNVYGCPEKI